MRTSEQPEAKRNTRWAPSDAQRDDEVSGSPREEDDVPRSGQRVSTGRSAARRWRCSLEITNPLTVRRRGPAFSTKDAFPKPLPMTNQRTPDQLIRFTVLVVCGLVVALTALAAVMTRPDINAEEVVGVLVLGVFALAATNSDVDARAGMGMSGNVMVLIASLVVFRYYGFFLGPILVGFFGAFDVQQIRERSWSKIAFNASADSLSLFAAAGLFWFIVGSGAATADLSQFIGVVVASATYLGLNSMLIAIPVSLTWGEPYNRVLRQIGAFNAGGFPFAILGLGLGWVYLELGAAVVPLLLVPILIARRSFSSYLELQASQEQTIE